MEYVVGFGQTFPVPVAVADHLLKLASHDQLKVLLYVLCHAETPVSQAQIVQACNVLPETVEEALAFWQSVNVLQTDAALPRVTVTAGNAPAVSPAAPPPAEPSRPAADPQPVRTAAPATSTECNVLPSEIADSLVNNAALAETFRTIEKKAGRPLKHFEQRSFFWMNEYLGLAPDLILMLAAFCIEQDLFQVRYMEQIAIEWQERGMTTHAQVQADIQRRTESRTYTGKIMRLFEMDRRPTKLQQSMIDAWAAGGISLDMIQIAYEKTRNATNGKLNFKYLNGIVEKWIAAGIRTPEQAEAADAAFYAQKEANQAPAPKAAPKEPENTSFELSDFDRLVNRF